MKVVSSGIVNKYKLCRTLVRVISYKRFEKSKNVFYTYLFYYQQNPFV